MYFRIITAINGRDALLAIGRESPDLVVTDLNMTDMDGFQMLCSFTPTPNSNGIEIIAVTGLDQYEITERGGLPPSVKVLYKPIRFTVLREVAEQILSMQDVY